MDREICIATARQRFAKKWENKILLWSEFAERLSKFKVGAETLEDYLKLSKDEQGKLKDVGGFVGGSLKDGRRTTLAVEHRDLITIDLDNIPNGSTEAVIDKVKALNCSAVIYSTRKHTATAPRLRVIIPSAEKIALEEYEPLARKVAFMIGLDYSDPTTFEPARLMYYPSSCKSAEQIYRFIEGDLLDHKKILGMYKNWRDVGEWDRHQGHKAVDVTTICKQQDPTTKQGIIGAFCRAYTVQEAIDKFLPNVYVLDKNSNRLTYANGSTVGGAVLYDNGKFLYSHHATDPVSGVLVNAFDLVRIHKFGDLDVDVRANTKTENYPSYKEMLSFANGDIEVTKQLFDVGKNEEDLAWLEDLKRSEKGGLLKTINNFVLILENDPNLKGKIAIDVFANRGICLGSVPWAVEDTERFWDDSDDAGVRDYIENTYNLEAKDKLADALLLVSNRHKINKIADYLEALEWDGVKRVDTLLIDYLGAQDTEYNRTVIRKTLAAAVARVYAPVKFDTMLILVGNQGTGKSTFLANLGKEWFSDSLTDFTGKQAMEMLQGRWIIEIGELAAFNKQEVNVIKQFLSKKDDIYRVPYGKRTQVFPRRCVFFGTSNEYQFLKDPTGNRRFLPVDTGEIKPIKNVWEDMPQEVDQIWAEALAIYKAGEDLFLNAELENVARERQEDHRYESEKAGMIAEYLNLDLPKNWYNLDLSQRRLYVNGSVTADENTETFKRQKICVAEIWTELFNGDMKRLKRSDSAEIISILSNNKTWTRAKSVLHFGTYGKQKGFIKIQF